MKNFSDEQIIASWNKNVTPWIKAVRAGEIESRRLVTNKAIMEAILKRFPRSVLDVGCGEGWLVRALAKAGINALGVDVVPGLIASAEKAGGGRFRLLSFEELSADTVKEKFDVVVCNFSVLGNESVNQLFSQVPSLSNEAGAFIVQTIHSVSGGGKEKYADGWREGSWAGFSDEFHDPAPWYFRTLETWKSMFLEHGFRLDAIREPLNPKTKIPASVVFTGVLTSYTLQRIDS